jgi:hypothetical protein
MSLTWIPKVYFDRGNNFQRGLGKIFPLSSGIFKRSEPAKNRPEEKKSFEKTWNLEYKNVIVYR